MTMREEYVFGSYAGSQELNDETIDELSAQLHEGGQIRAHHRLDVRGPESVAEMVLDEVKYEGRTDGWVLWAITASLIAMGIATLGVMIASQIVEMGA